MHNNLRIGSFLILLTMLSGCGEREGSVKYHDCREKIDVKDVSFDRYFKTYTCEYRKTNQGKIMGGHCVHIEYDNAGQCKAAYTYIRKQDDWCPDKAYPRLNFDDKCYPN